MVPLDKQAHFWAGMAIAATVTLYTGIPLLGFIVGVVAAALKEIFDSLGYGTPDKWDFVVTVLGAMVVLPLLFL